MNYNIKSEFDNTEEAVEKSCVCLSIFQYKNEIIETVRNNQFVIILGEPGCGKTTQVPQYLYHAGLHENETIGISQPRRIAAVSMAERVAKEMKVILGETVGYEIRFNQMCGAATKIKYMTDGILLNECIRDKQLNKYKIIIIDEAHERSLETDLTLGLLKIIAKRRKDLKIIISSATINSETFSNFFENCKVIKVENVLLPVEIIYCDFKTDLFQKALEIIEEIYLKEKDNEGKKDILLFVTCMEQIVKCCNKLKEFEGVVPKPFCGAIDFESQKEAFDPVGPFEMKVVVATNIAETSLTIEGIKYVIDCGYVRQNNYDKNKGIEILEDIKISKAQAIQRSGRAGRTGPGICYRLYLEDTFKRFKEETFPEIYRKNLSEIYLKLIALRLKDFHFLDKPDSQTLQQYITEFVDLRLMDSVENLTRNGFRVASLPLDPILGKILLISLKYKCTTYVIRLVAMFSEKTQNIFKSSLVELKEVESKRAQFFDENGDHFALLNLYDAFIKQENPQEWCKENYIDFSTMENVQKVIKEIYCIFKRNGREINDDEMNSDRENIKKCFVRGYFNNICIRQRGDAYNRVTDKQVLFLIRNSCLWKRKPKIILFQEALKSKKTFACGIMQLDESFLRKFFKKELELIKFPQDIHKVPSFVDN